MRILHIPAKSRLEIEIPDKVLKKIPKNLGLVTTIQHLDKVKPLEKKLSAVFAGQILGCRTEAADKIREKVDGFLYIGTGRFHPTAVAMNTGKEVLCFDPKTKALSKITKEEIESFEKRKRAGYVKYLHSTKIGILISTKSGQNHVKEALKFKADHKEDGKEYFLFAFETLNIGWLENFPFIQCWINTACPRMAEDAPGIVNLRDIKSFEK